MLSEMRVAMARASSVSYFRRSMMSASPRPVNPRPTRRFAIASLCCCSSGQAVTSSTLSSMRTDTSTVFAKCAKSNFACSVKGAETYLVRSMEPRQRLLGAGVSSLDRLAVIQVVVAVDAVEEEDAGLGVVVRRAHDLVPQVARPHLAVDPLPVGALAGLLGRGRAM